MRFPKRVYLTVDGDEPDDYLVTNEALTDIDGDGTQVAIYERVKTGYISVRKTFVAEEKEKSN